ncbi:hypothetical protein EC990672_5258C, partial [Escherichia coli 99.0672]
HPPE